MHIANTAQIKTKRELAPNLRSIKFFANTKLEKASGNKENGR